jgi:homeodomain-containing protein
MQRQYHVTLTPEQRDRLQQTAQSHRTSQRQRTHARILLLPDTRQPSGALPDAAICHAAHTTPSTVARVRHRFATAGLEPALYHKPQENRKPRALDGEAEAHLVALVCGAPPEGHQRWTLHLLKDTLIQRGYTNTVSHETVRQTLKKTNSSLG